MRTIGWGALGLGSLLVACAATGPVATPVAGPSGGEAQLIRCSDTAACYDKAREVCGGPYRIVDSGTKVSTTTIPRATMVRSNSGGIYANTSQNGIPAGSILRTTDGTWRAEVHEETMVTSTKELVVECGPAGASLEKASASN